MKQTTIQTLYAYWDSVRAGRIAPRRLDIEPAGIATILAETFMLECEEGDYRYRLAGSRLCELFGYELRGTSFLAGWSKDDLALIERQLAVICSEGAAAHMAIEAGGEARQRIELEVLLLPLLHTGDRIGRVIGAMSATSQPQWPDKGRLVNRRLLRHELIRPERLSANRLALEGHRRPPLPMELSAPRVVHGDGRQFRVLDGGRADGKHSKS